MFMKDQTISKEELAAMRQSRLSLPKRLKLQDEDEKYDDSQIPEYGVSPNLLRKGTLPLRTNRSIRNNNLPEMSKVRRIQSLCRSTYGPNVGKEVLNSYSLQPRATWIGDGEETKLNVRELHRQQKIVRQATKNSDDVLFKYLEYKKSHPKKDNTSIDIVT